MNTTISHEKRPHAGPIRRLMSVVYDLLLVLALLIVVTAIENFALNHGHAIDPGNPYYWPFRFSLLVVIFLYFGWFWTHGGQTLGMKTWKMKLCSKDGKPVGWQQAIIYFLAASLPLVVFGICFLWSYQNHASKHGQIVKLVEFLSLAVYCIGFLWSLFNKNHVTWHELIAKCEMLDMR